MKQAAQIDHQREVLDDLAERLHDAIVKSSPLCTYPEIKDVLAAQYYRYVIKMRLEHGLTWREVAGPAGMTPQGIQKLGDKHMPRAGDSPIRRMLGILQESGEEGLTAGELAGRFYENRDNPAAHDMTFDEVLDCLEAGGEARLREGRWIAHEPRPVVTLAAARDVLILVQGAGDEGMSFAELASQFYDQRAPRDRTDLAQVTRLLEDAADIVVQDGRFIATTNVVDLSKRGGVSDKTVRSIVRTTSKIGDTVRASSGAGDAQLFRLSFHVPDDPRSIPTILDTIQKAILDVVVTTENAALETGEPTRQMTVIHGAALGLP